MSAPDTWIEVSVVADPEAVEAVSEILNRVAPGGVSIEGAFEFVDDGLSARPDLSAPATLRAYLPGSDAAAAKRAFAQLETDLGHLQAFDLRPIGQLSTRIIHEEDWAHAWKRHFPVLRIGRRVVIRPTWRRHRARPDDVVIALDPGMAFGTGLHPTTRLCLAGVEAWADEGLLTDASVLDLGCGSGILGLAAAKFGAHRVVGLDTDPIAVEATRLNARRNRSARIVRPRRGTLPAADGPFDLVLANLIASLLETLAIDLYGATRPGSGAAGSGGRLLASGIFIDREAQVRRALLAAGFHVRRRHGEGDWVALEAERID